MIRDYGDTLTKDSIFTTSSKQIGTIGVDICRDKILIIDYPNKRFCLLNELPLAYNCNFVDFTVNTNGKVVLDMGYKGRTYKVLFDNGSSAFPVIIRHDLLSRLSQAANTDTLGVRSWGRMLNFIGRPMKDTFSMAGRTFSDVEIYTSMKPGQENLESGCDATTGNALFWNNIVIIDFKNKKFGVK
jgi:hypothetical protein